MAKDVGFNFILYLITFITFVGSESQQYLQLKKHFCVDDSSLVIDGYKELEINKFQLFFIFNGLIYTINANWDVNDKYPSFINVTQNSVSALEKEPLADDPTDINRGRTTTTKLPPISAAFLFDSKFKVYSINEDVRSQPNIWTLTGFNQVWLGCPQPLCLYGSLDATVATDSNMYFFSGKHVWTFDHSKKKGMLPLTRNAMEISPGIFDSGLYLMNSDIALIKGDLMLLFDSNLQPTSSRKWRDIYPTDIIADASFNIGYYQYIFSGDNIYQFYEFASSGRKVIDATTINDDFTHIDAALYRPDKYLIIFKRWMFYVSESFYEGQTIHNKTFYGPYSTVTEYFGCNEVYKNSIFNNFTTLKENILDKLKVPIELSHNETVVDTTTTQPATSSNRLPLLIVVAVFIGIVICVFVYYSYQYYEYRTQKMEVDKILREQKMPSAQTQFSEMSGSSLIKPSEKSTLEPKVPKPKVPEAKREKIKMDHSRRVRGKWMLDD